MGDLFWEWEPSVGEVPWLLRESISAAGWEAQERLSRNLALAKGEKSCKPRIVVNGWT